MKMRTSVVLSMVGALSISSAALAAEVYAQASPEQEAGMPGVGAEAVETATATVKAVDLDKREVTLVTPDGKEQTVTVGPEARNLPQVKVGDQVVVKFYQAIALQLKKATSAVRSRTERVYAGRTPLGAKPGGFVGRTVDAVGTVEAVAAAKPAVKRDARLARQVDQRGGVASHHVLDRALAGRNLDPADPIGEVGARVLLEDPLAVDSVRKPLVVERPPDDVREHRPGHLLVVAGQIRLRYVRRKQDLVGTSDFDGAAPRLDRDAHEGTSRTTSRAALSSRSPW